MFFGKRDKVLETKRLIDKKLSENGAYEDYFLHSDMVQLQSLFQEYVKDDRYIVKIREDYFYSAYNALSSRTIITIKLNMKWADKIGL